MKILRGAPGANLTLPTLRGPILVLVVLVAVTMTGTPSSRDGESADPESPSSSSNDPEIRHGSSHRALEPGQTAQPGVVTSPDQVPSEPPDASGSGELFALETRLLLFEGRGIVSVGSLEGVAPGLGVYGSVRGRDQLVFVPGEVVSSPEVLDGARVVTNGGPGSLLRSKRTIGTIRVLDPSGQERSRFLVERESPIVEGQVVIDGMGKPTQG